MPKLNRYFLTRFTFSMMKAGKRSALRRDQSHGIGFVNHRWSGEKKDGVTEMNDFARKCALLNYIEPGCGEFRFRR